MMLRKSQALREFHSLVAVAETLIKKEHLFADPPPPRYYREVQGLRGGAMVLMVAAFENYLKEVVEERLDDLMHHRKYNPKNLPDQLLFHNCNQTLRKSIELSSSSTLTHADKNAIFQ